MPSAPEPAPIADTEAKATEAKAAVPAGQVEYADSVTYEAALAWFEKRRPTYIRLAKAVEPYVRRDGIVVDVGANIGYFTKLLGETLNLTGTVHLFEPVPNLAALCRVTVDALPFQTHVHEYGLGARDDEIEIFTDINGNLGWNTIIAERATGMTASKIQVRKFVPEMIEGPPAFIKIDVEGAESTVLEGMLDALTAWNPRPPVLCEIGWGQAHPHWQQELAVFTRMLDLGYRVVDLEGRPVDLTAITSTRDVIFLPDGVEPVTKTAAPPKAPAKAPAVPPAPSLVRSVARRVLPARLRSAIARRMRNR